jgi:transmembrane sensor
MDQERIFSLWARYLAGEATPEEVEELEWAFVANPDLRRAAELLYGTRQSPPKGSSDEQEQQMLERGLQRFKGASTSSVPVIRRISTPDPPLSAAPPAPELPSSQAPRRRVGMSSWIAAASLLAVAAGLVLYLHKGKRSPEIATVVSAPRGAKKFMQLADGSKLWLNAGSKIMLSNTFASGNREMTLEGEAFLDVRHDEQHPFVIHAGRLVVRVLGTELNVRAYPGDSTMETTLINGKVEVGVTGEARSAILLHPNEKLTIAMSRPVLAANNADSLATNGTAAPPVRFLRAPIEPDRTDGTITETSWVSNKLVFRQETLSAMARRLERWYDVTIVFDNQRFRSDTLSGTFPQEPLADVMHALQITAGFHYHIDKDTVHIW